MACCRSIGVDSIRGWSVGSISAFHSGSEVSATRSSFKASSLVRCVSTAWASDWRRAAAFGLRLYDVDQGHRADLDPEPVVRHELLGQRQRLPLHVRGGARIDEIPVGEADLGERVDDDLFEVDVRDVPG